MIVGDGKQMDVLKKMTKKLDMEKRVIFVGESLFPEKYYVLADVFVMPSKQEGLCNAFIEALSCGIPIIGFKSKLPKIVTPTEDFVNGFNCGFAVENEKDMVDKIDYLFDNPSQLKKFKNNAIKRSKKFDWNIEIDKLLRIIKKFGVSLK